MGKPTVVFPDAERLTVDILAEMLYDREPDVRVGVVVPGEFKAGHPSFVQVALDGTPRIFPFVTAAPTIRIVAWSVLGADSAAVTGGPTEAKRLAHLCQGLLLGHPGDHRVLSYTFLAGPWLARDERSRAYLAAFTVRATVRAQPL